MNLKIVTLKKCLRASPLVAVDSASWNPDNLFYAQYGLAAFTFCDVPIEPVDAAR